MNTIIRPSTPNSRGDNNRAKKIPIKNVTPECARLLMRLHLMPLTVLLFNDSKFSTF